MSDDYRKDRAESHPTDLAFEARQLESLFWIHNQLGRLDRLPACTRKEALKKTLTQLLDASDFTSPKEMSDALKASRDNILKMKSDHAKQVSDLNTRIKELDAECKDRDLRVTEPKPKGFSFVSSFLGLAAGFILCFILVTRNFNCTPIPRDATIPDERVVPSLKP